MTPKYSQGLTLIEVLVALAITAIAMAAILQSTSNTIRAYQYLRDKTSALWVAENVAAMTQLRLVGVQNRDEERGNMLMFDQNWYWSLKRESSQQANIIRVMIKVFARESDDSPIYSLETYAHVPTPK